MVDKEQNKFSVPEGFDNDNDDYKEFEGEDITVINFNLVKILLNEDRETLYNKINLRVDKMMNDGLLNEVIQLKTYNNLNALKTVGYKELFSYLEGEITLETAIDKIKQHTRNYAKLGLIIGGSILLLIQKILIVLLNL